MEEEERLDEGEEVEVRGGSADRAGLAVCAAACVRLSICVSGRVLYGN